MLHVLYPQHFLLNNEHERLIVVGIEIAHFDRRFLLLSYALALAVQQLDLDVRVCLVTKLGDKNVIN